MPVPKEKAPVGRDSTTTRVASLQYNRAAIFTALNL
jgi:hypothetical protein